MKFQLPNGSIYDDNLGFHEQSNEAISYCFELMETKPTVHLKEEALTNAGEPQMYRDTYKEWEYYELFFSVATEYVEGPTSGGWAAEKRKTYAIGKKIRN